MRTAARIVLVATLATGCKQDSRPTAPTPAEAGPPAAPTQGAAGPAPTTPATPTDDAAIRAVFADYRAAIERGDGTRAAALLDRSTMDLYARLKTAALTMPGDEVRQQPLVERLTIVAMRAGRTRAQIEALTTQELLAAAITQGTGVSSVRGVELSEIVVEGDLAHARPRKDGLALPLTFAFRREGAAWRFDLTHMMAKANELLASQLRGMSEDQLIRAYVASVGGTVDEAMWEPPP
jgi:hypothetical protein